MQIIVFKDKRKQPDEESGIPKHCERNANTREASKETILKKPFLYSELLQDWDFEKAQ